MKYFHSIEKNADAIVTLTEGDYQLWTKAKRIEIIPNFSNIDVHQLYDYAYVLIDIVCVRFHE